MFIDISTSCIRKSDFLVKRGVEAVGRYYSVTHPQFALTQQEAQELSSKKIRIFAVFEDTGQANKFNLTKIQGNTDAVNALSQAEAIGQPHGGVIYFAVEGLPSGYRTVDLPGVRDYFAGVTQGLAGKYKPGVYGDGIVCKTPLDEGICSHTWLAQASYSFEGSIDFYASKRWTLAQIVCDLDAKGWSGLSVDLDEGRGDIGSFLVAPAATV